MTKDLRRKLKELLIERLKFEDMTPDDIPDDEPLFGGGLGLDSIDALEIVVMLEIDFDARKLRGVEARAGAAPGLRSERRAQRAVRRSRKAPALCPLRTAL